MMQIFTRSVASKKDWVSMAVLPNPIGHIEIAMVDAAFPEGSLVHYECDTGDGSYASQGSGNDACSGD